MKQSPRHTCCINTLRSIEENVCRGPLTAKTNKYTKAPYIPPCSPLLLLKTEIISWKNSLIWGNGVPTICRLLQTPKSHPRRKRKESSPKVITGYREPGGSHWGWNRSPWRVQGTKEANPQHMRGAMPKTGSMCALRLLLWTGRCGSLGGRACSAEMLLAMVARAWQSQQGTRGTAKDHWEEHDADMMEGHWEPKGLLVNFSGTQKAAAWENSALKTHREKWKTCFLSRKFKFLGKLALNRHPSDPDWLGLTTEQH